MTITSSPPRGVRPYVLTSAVVASIAATLGGALALILCVVDLVTSLALPPKGQASDQYGTTLTGASYFWERYGVWLFDGVIAVAVGSGLLLTWVLLVRGRGTASFWFAVVTCCTSVIPLVIIAPRTTFG